jgi:hypothetical protein
MNLQAAAIIQGVDQKLKQGKSIFVVAHGERAPRDGGGER